MRLTAFLNFLVTIPAFSPPVPAVNIAFPWGCTPPKLNIPELFRLLLVAVGAKLKPAGGVAINRENVKIVLIVNTFEGKP